VSSALLEALFAKGLELFYRRRYNWNTGSSAFPLSLAGKNYLFQPLFSDDGVSGFWSGFYNEPQSPPLYLDPFDAQLELAWGSRLKAGETYRATVENAAIPYMILKPGRLASEKGRSVLAKVGGKPHALGGQVAERYYYLFFKEKTELELSSSCDLVVGRPIALTQAKPHRKRLVLNLFVDGLTAELFKLHPLEEAAPNIHRFFSKGTAFSDCHVTSEWSLPGLASLHTGLRVAKHRMFSPKGDVAFGRGYPVAAELFQKDGYLGFQACGNWRKSPSYGYARGFDRTVYKRQLSLKDVNYAFFDQLRAFPDRDTFAWLSFFDLHHMINAVPDVGDQARYAPDAHDYTSSKKKSVLQSEINRPKTKRYVQELGKIDFYLNQVFSLIQDRYSEDEVLVSLVADHGTGYITGDPHILSRERTHVPWLLRGGGVPAGVCGEPVQNVDVLPSLLTLSGLAVPAGLDGRLPARLGGGPARAEITCESFFPGSTYKATIKDKAFDFYFETEDKIGADGRFDASRFKTELYRAGDFRKEVSAEEPAAAARFLESMRAFLRESADCYNRVPTSDER
jgi:hypothetical protein